MIFNRCSPQKRVGEFHYFKLPHHFCSFVIFWKPVRPKPARPKPIRPKPIRPKPALPMPIRPMPVRPKPFRPTRPRPAPDQDRTRILSGSKNYGSGQNPGRTGPGHDRETRCSRAVPGPIEELCATCPDPTRAEPKKPNECR